jgi:hypothetical protein
LLLSESLIVNLDKLLQHLQQHRVSLGPFLLLELCAKLCNGDVDFSLWPSVKPLGTLLKLVTASRPTSRNVGVGKLMGGRIDSALEGV